MNNYQWLLQMDGAERKAWFDAEHVENQERALDGDTDAQNADSRELILTDLEKKTREWHDYDGNFMRIYSGVAYAQMKELLDRQAAITERKCLKPNWDYCETCETLEKLAAERDELKGQVFTLKVECDDLTSACDDLENELHKAKAERERYREKFGKCLDYADAIHALMDDEGMA